MESISCKSLLYACEWPPPPGGKKIEFLSHQRGTSGRTSIKVQPGPSSYLLSPDLFALIKSEVPEAP